MGKHTERRTLFIADFVFLCSEKGEIPPKNHKNRRIDASFINFYPKILKVDSNNAVHLIWRRRRDLNPCYSFPYYSLSRGAPWATWVLLHPINEYITFYYSCQLIMWKFFILVGFYLFLNSFVVFAPSAKYLVQSAILNITLVIMMFHSLLLRWKRFFQYGRNKK